MPVKVDPDFEKRLKKWLNEDQRERSHTRAKMQSRKVEKSLQLKRDYSHLTRDFANAKDRAAETSFSRPRRRDWAETSTEGST